LNSFVRVDIHRFLTHTMGEEIAGKKQRVSEASGMNVDGDEARGPSISSDSDPDLPAAASARGHRRKKVNLSQEALGIIEAINNGPIAKGLQTVRQDIVELRATAAAQDKRLEDLERKMTHFEVCHSRQPPPSDAGSDFSTAPPSARGGRSFPVFDTVGNPYEDDRNIPFNKRKTIVCGGWKKDTESQLIRTDLDNIFAGIGGVVRRSCSGRFNSIGKVVFTEPATMWNFIRPRKGTTLTVPSGPHQGTQIWFSVEKSVPEMEVSSRVSRALSALLPALKELRLIPDSAERNTKHLPADFLRGIIWFRRDPDDPAGDKVRLTERKRDEYNLNVVVEGWQQLGISIDKDQFLKSVNQK